jgi:hypothetical protein
MWTLRLDPKIEEVFRVGLQLRTARPWSDSQSLALKAMR